MEVRKEVLEFGLLPISVLLPKFDTLTALTEFHSKLQKEANVIDGRGGYVSIDLVCKCLKISSEVWDLFLNFLKSLSEEKETVCNEEETHVDLHMLSLFLFVQIYGRQAYKRQDCEVQQPMKKEGTSSRGPVPRMISTLTFPSFLRRHLYTLLYLIKDDPPDSPSPSWCLPRSPSPGVVSPPLDRFPNTAQMNIAISGKEVNRLGFLLKPSPKPFGASSTGIVHGHGVNNDITKKTLASCLRCFKSSKDQVMEVGCLEVAATLKYSIRDTDPETESIARSSRICGMTKGILVKGEDSFSDHQLIIRECQDSCIYVLAPLKRAKITACSDCIIVIGPTSGCVIVENCTRLKLIYACQSTFITACHESIIHLASNCQPLLFGDNRFLQLAPYNIEYEYLAAHLESAGLPVSPNLWDKPHIINISKNQSKGEISVFSEGSGSFDFPYANSGEGESGSHETSSAFSRLHLESRKSSEDYLLPADQLLPFTVPFKGGPGPLAGGATTNSQGSWVSRLASGLGNGPPFPLSDKYKEALTTRLRKVSELQESVGKAIVDLNNRRDIQVVIQSYFKEWLMKTAKIRQVYDLAKLEQQMIAEAHNENPEQLKKSEDVDVSEIKTSTTL